jgi:hypothetical protein
MVYCLLIGINIAICFLMSNQSINVSQKSEILGTQPNEDGFEINIDETIEPPLGNSTTLPSFATFFTLYLFNFPIEISIIFIGEIVFGSAMNLDKKRLTLTRFGIMMGAAAAIAVGTSLVHYLMVWPAIHDLPIHNAPPYTDPITEEVKPQYGDAQPLFSKGVDITLLIFAAIIIIGLHYPVMRFIQGMKNTPIFLTMALPLIYYPVLWNTLAKQITKENFMDKMGTHFNLLLLLALAFVFGFIIKYIWEISQSGLRFRELDESNKEKATEEVS